MLAFYSAGEVVRRNWCYNLSVKYSGQMSISTPEPTRPNDRYWQSGHSPNSTWRAHHLPGSDKSYDLGRAVSETL